MAEVYISEFQDQFRCSICLNLLKDPVTIPCGHSFCMICITDCWNQDAENRVYFCPQCRQTFTPRPILVKNIMLIQVVEKLKKTHFQTDGSGPSYAGPEDVECDVCTERKHKPVKSCLVCLETYCQTHFERHEEFYSGKRHKVTEATERLQEMICSQHDKLLEVFCRTDQTFICLWCTMDEHKNHDTVSAALEKQRLLEDNHRKFQQRIEQKEKKLHELRETIKTHKIAAQSAVEDTERLFTELIRSIERRRSEVIQLIRDQEKTAVSRAEGVLKELEQEIDDLRRKQEEIQQLHTDDHISFIQNFESLSGSSGSTDVITVSPLPSFDDVKKSVIQLKEKVDDLCAREIGKRSGEVSSIENIPTTESMTRRELLQYFHLFSLDPNTVNNHVCLSEEDRTASGTKPVQQYPDHPDRFDFFRQVLCRESVSGRCYWEVEWSGLVRISVSYKTIKRKGKTFDCMFGRNDESWCLLCSSTKFSFWHDYKPTKLPVVSGSSRIGVFVDHSAGILSFYSVSDTMTLIHRVHTTFTQPLYPGFLIRQVSAVTLLTVGNV